jgi:EAL domain-containing protein (putative c-di-GMP-specific phosphodiesterase class I)/GGDEF domain-containing protein
MSLTNIIEDDVHTPYLRAFDVEYPPENLLFKAQQYQLDTSALAGVYQVDLIALEQLYHVTPNEEKNDALDQLFVLIATWPANLDNDDLCLRINQCVAQWVVATQSQTQMTTITNLLRCLSLNCDTQTNLTPELHLYFFEILGESLQLCQQQQINYLLNHDAVTNLPNTHLLLEEIRQIANTSTNAAFSLLSIRFLIERGTNTVSPVLQPTLSIKVAELLATCFPGDFSIYQSGTLFFNVLIRKNISATQLHLLAAKIQRCYEQIIQVDHQVFIVMPVIGAAIEAPSFNYSHMYDYARVALNHALTNHLDVVIYTPEISEAVERQKKLELDITDAFNNEDLDLYLQPIVSLPDGHCVGAEVLLRWPNAKTKGIYPNVMVEIINKVGLGKMFTRWLIHSVCRLANQLINQNKLSVYLTLNLRAEDLYDKDLPLLILQSSQFWKIQPENLILEITENGILEENETTFSTIQQITDNGFKLALDDFGTGYSSMARLRNMPISLIKIDQSFVRQIHLSDKDFRMVQSMASLAESIGKDVLVEGIENEDALKLINQIGIRKAQGYYFSKPLPFDEFVSWAKINSAS